jgi:hypothetical protein
VPGEGNVALEFNFVYRGGVFGNEVVVFKVDDDSGSINGLHPGDPGYLDAVLDPGTEPNPPRAQVIFAGGSFAGCDASCVNVTLPFQAGDRLAFFIVQNSTLATLRTGNPSNSIGGDPVAFFSLNSLNPDGVDHMLAFHSLGLGTTEFTFEDLTGGGDRDYEDVVFTVRVQVQVP